MALRRRRRKARDHHAGAPQARRPLSPGVLPTGSGARRGARARRTRPITVPSGTFERVLVTSEFSPLEPQTEEKYYVAGVGEILERVVKGHHEEFRLVGYTR